jgi:hypothetical protein
VGNPTIPDATPCVEPGCQEEGVVGLNIARLCLTHFEADTLRTGAMSGSSSIVVKEIVGNLITRFRE